MKKAITRIASLIILISGCSSVDNIRETEKPIVIDGKQDDWPHLIRFEKNLGIIYGVTHDRNNLYVLAKIYEEETKRKVISSGLTVWLDPNAKKRRNMAVKYPILSGGVPNKSRDAKERPEFQPSQLDDIVLVGIVSDKTYHTQKSYLKMDLDAMIGFDSTRRNLLYELKVPLKFLEGKAKRSLSGMSIGFEISSVGRTGNVQRSGRGGMKQAGGRLGGPSQKIRTPPEPVSFWYKVVL